MNGTVVDIEGITVSVIPIELENSTDKAHLLTIKDNNRVITLSISYGQITQITNEQICSSKHE